MESPNQAIEDRLQKHLPFLRQMLGNLNPDCPQHKKIKALCDIIDKSKKVKYATLEKCEKVILLLQSKTYKRTSASQKEEKDGSLFGDPQKTDSASHNSPLSNDLQSPDSEQIRSPSPTSTCSSSIAESSERYLRDRPSIYAAVAETIHTSLPLPEPTKPLALDLDQIVPKVDTSEPLISAEELELLQAETTNAEKEGTSESAETKTDSAIVSHRSKMSLVPTPFHKRKASSDKNRKENERTKKDTKGETKSQPVVKPSSKPSGSSGSNTTKIEPVKIFEGDSIFGNLLSSLDEKLFSDKKKHRRDSKDKDNASESSKRKPSVSKAKESDKSDKNGAEIQKLQSKIKAAEKDMNNALKKEGLKKEEIDEIKYKYQDKIRRYTKLKELLKKSTEFKIKEKPKSTNETKSSSEPTQSKSKEKVSTPVSKGVPDQKQNDESTKEVKLNITPSKPNPPASLKVDLPPLPSVPTIKPKSISSDIIPNPIRIEKVEARVEPKLKDSSYCHRFSPPPQVEMSKPNDCNLSYLGTPNPYNNDTLEIRTPADPFSTFIPRNSINFESPQPKRTFNESSYEDKAARVDPRLRMDHHHLALSPPGFRKADPHKMNPDPFSDPYMESSSSENRAKQHSFRNPLGPKVDPFAPQPPRMRHPLPPAPPQHNTRDHSFNDRWIPPPVQMPQHQAPRQSWNRQHQPSFHPFDPISPEANEYDLSKMPPQDFYAPASASNVPNSYKQWRALKQRDEERKRMLVANEQMELRRLKIKAYEEQIALEAKKAELEEMLKNANKKEADKVVEDKGKEVSKESIKDEVVNKDVENKEEKKDVGNKEEKKNVENKEEKKDVGNKEEKKDVEPVVEGVVPSEDTSKKIKETVAADDPEKQDKQEVITIATADTPKKEVEDERTEPIEEKLSQEEFDNKNKTLLENIDNLNTEGLLKILSEAKQNKNPDGGTYLPTRVVELVASLLQKQGTSTKEAEHKNKEKIKQEMVISDPHIDSTEGTSVSTPLPESPPVTTQENTSDVSSTPVKEDEDQVANVTESPKTEEKVDPPIMKRLRQRTKEINYNAVKILNVPKKTGKRKNRQSDAKNVQVENVESKIDESNEDLLKTPEKSETNVPKSNKNVEKEMNEDSIVKSSTTSSEDAKHSKEDTKEKIEEKLSNEDIKENIEEELSKKDIKEMVDDLPSSLPEETPSEKTLTSIKNITNEVESATEKTFNELGISELDSSFENIQDDKSKTHESPPNKLGKAEFVSKETLVRRGRPKTRGKKKTRGRKRIIHEISENIPETQSEKKEDSTSDLNKDQLNPEPQEEINTVKDKPQKCKSEDDPHQDIKETIEEVKKDEVSPSLELQEEVKTGRKKSQNRKSELDILHQDIKETIGEGVLVTTKRKGKTRKNLKYIEQDEGLDGDDLLESQKSAEVEDEKVPDKETSSQNESQQASKDLSTINNNSEQLNDPSNEITPEVPSTTDNLTSPEEQLTNEDVKTPVQEPVASEETIKKTSAPRKREYARKSTKILRVVLQKIPDIRESTSRPVTPVTPPTRQRLARASKAAVLSYNEVGVRTPSSDREKAKKDDKEKLDENSESISEELLNSTLTQSPSSVKARKLKKDPVIKPAPEEDLIIDVGVEPSKLTPDYIPDKNYYWKSEVNDCKLCTFSGPQIVLHYIQEHPESELLISRLSPEATQEAFQESVLNDYASVKVANLGGKKPAKFDFRCRFCSHDLQKELTATFFDHVSSHTGEARYHCIDCPYKHHLKPIVKTHIAFEHHKKEKEPIVDCPPMNYDKLFGYICSECNFLQLRKESVELHIQKYHQKDTTYVYTINMSLPILQRSLRGRKPILEEIKESDMTVPEVRKLRGQKTQKKRKLESSENSVKSLMQKLTDGTESVVDFNLPEDLLENTKSNLSMMEDTPPKSTSKPPPSSAFVLDNWDELLYSTKEPEPELPQKVSKRSTFIDKLKERFEQASAAAEIPVTRRSPIDNEFTCTSAMHDEPEPKSDEEQQMIASPRKAAPTSKKASRLAAISPKGENILLKPDEQSLVATPKLLSVNVVDALIDADHNVSYICRKPSCIFQTTARRVLEAHCNYTHKNCNDAWMCNVCQKKQPTMRMLRIFLHLCEHVDAYLGERKAIKEQELIPAPEIKKELIDITLEVNTEKLDTELIENGGLKKEEVPLEEKSVSGPSKLSFQIVKVESLANTTQGTLPPLPPLNPIPMPSLSPISQPIVPMAITCKIVPMVPIEIRSRKNPLVLKNWIQDAYGLLFACPAYSCPFSTASEPEFDNHLETHDFGDAFLPCLYCNFKMRKEFLKVHLMMRHAHCNYGCGYCLYRAVRAEYVKLHQIDSHPSSSLDIRTLQPPLMLNRYRQPSLPPMSTVIKPYVCSCQRKFYCLQTFELHLTKFCNEFEKKLSCSICRVTFKTASVLLLHFEACHNYYEYCCRYCVFGAKTARKIVKHIAFNHSSHDVVVVRRRDKDKESVTTDDEPPDILTRLNVLTELGDSVVKTSQINAVVVTSKNVTTVTNTSTTISPSKDNQAVPRVVLFHPIYIGASGKQPAIVMTPSQASGSATTLNSIVNNQATSPISKPTSNDEAPPIAISDESREVQHNQSLLATEVIKPEEVYKCNQCLNVLVNAASFTSHIIACKDEKCPTKPYVCFYCKKDYKLTSSLTEHIRSHGIKNVICGLCGHREPNSLLLKKHVKNVHKLNNILILPVDPLKGDIERDEFIGKPVNAQIGNSVPSQPEVENNMQNSDNTIFGPGDIVSLPMCPIFKFVARCKLCDFSTKVRSNFLRHMSLHTTGKIDLNVPVVEAVNPVPCLEKNELMFDKMINLAASSFESTGRMGKTTTTTIEIPSGLQGLRIPEFIPVNKRYVCGAPGCNYLCLEEQNLRHHLQALHDNEQTYKCIHCQENLNPIEGKSFIDIDAIFNHLRLHESNLYKCWHCFYFGNSRNKIEKHNTEVHQDKRCKLITIRQDPEEVGEAEKQKKLWRCGVCVCRKATEEAIREHVKDKHALYAQYKCTYCAYRDESREKFDKHFSSVHPSLSPDIIVAYYKEKEKEEHVEKEDLQIQFDTTPLWVKNRINNIKHIRGILLDETETINKRAKLNSPNKIAPKSFATTSTKRRLSAKTLERITSMSKKPKSDSEPSANVSSTNAAMQNTSTTTSSEIIDISDDIDESTSAMTDANDPSITKPINELQKGNFIPTYGPLGTPNNSLFSCPLCEVNDFANEENFKQHLYDELQYNRYECVLCNKQTTSFQKMNSHYTEKHLALCETDSLKQLEKNASIESWINKVISFQRRIINHNNSTNKETAKKSSAQVAYICFHCSHEGTNYSEMVAHSKAAHPKREVKLLNMPSIVKPQIVENVNNILQKTK